MEDVLARFREALVADDLADKSVESYVGSVGLFIRWYEKTFEREFRAEDIVTRVIQEYRAYMKRKPMAAETVNRRLASLRKFFGWLGGENPASGVKGLKIADRGVESLSPAEFRRLMVEVYCHKSLRDIAIMEVLCMTGMRVGELVSIRLADVDLDRGVILIRDGKGSVAREVELLCEARSAVMAYMDCRLQIADSRLGSDEWLFLGERGRLTYSGARGLVRRYGDFAKIPNLRVHQLRHTFVRRLLDNKEDLVTIAGLTGHTSLRQLLRYGKASKAARRAAVEGLSLGGE